MKNLSELDDNVLLTITQKGYCVEVMCKKDFLQSSYYIDREDVNVAVAEETYATFELEYALEMISDEMHEDWLENIMNAIPAEVKKRIEDEINGYLKNEPTYYEGEVVVL